MWEELPITKEESYLSTDFDTSLGELGFHEYSNASELGLGCILM